MKKMLRRTGSLIVSLLVVMPLLCGSSARADGLLEAMIDIALRAGRAIEATVSVDAETLLANMGAGAEAAEWGLVSNILNDGSISVLYAKDDDCDVIGIAFKVKGETVVNCEARVSEDAYELTTSLLPGKTIIIPVQTAAQTLNRQTPEIINVELINTLADAAMKYIAVLEAWAAENKGILTVNERTVPASQTRDAAARTETFRVTGAQWQDLLRLLADEFMNDEALLRELASQAGDIEPEDLTEAVNQFINSLGEPDDCFAETTVYYGNEGQVIGADARLEAPEEMPRGNFSYGRVTIDAEHSADSAEGSISWGDGYEVRTRFGFINKSSHPFLPGKRDEYYGSVSMNLPSAGAFMLEVLGNIFHNVEPIEESYEHIFNLRLTQKPDDDPTGDFTRVFQTPLLDMGFVLKSRTEAIIMDDFLSDGSFTIKIMGQKAAINYTLRSIVYEPVHRPDNIIVRYESLTAEETEALAYEAIQNFLESLQKIQKLYVE